MQAGTNVAERPAPSRTGAARALRSALPGLERRAELLGRLDLFAPLVVVVICLLGYAVVHAGHAARPVTNTTLDEWSSWFDQGNYLRAAAAWSRLDLSPAQHWYPFGYPVLGALGRLITPVQPFYVPDALLLAASAWLFGLLTAAVLGNRPGARALGVSVFLGTTALNYKAFEIWVVPWTTTAATPLIYACLLFALRFLRRPDARTCGLVGLCGGGIGLFRPTEAALVLACAGGGMAWAAWRHRISLKSLALIVAFGLTGTGAMLALFLLGEYATGGFDPAGYLAYSAQFGFEWRLVPLHWIGVFGDPRPFWPNEHGLQTTFPWIMPGVVGLAVALACCARAHRPMHLLLISAVIAHCTVFLAYRDMEPSQIWWIYLYHYFKWVLPVLGLYAVLLVPAMVRRPSVAIPLGLAVGLVLVPWRLQLELVPGTVRPITRVDASTLQLASGLGSIQDAVLVTATGGFVPVFQGQHRLRADGREWRAPFAFRAYPRPNGFVLLPRRPLPAAETVVHFEPGIVLDPDVAPRAARQAVVLGRPCWLGWWRLACNPGPELPGPPLPIGQRLDFRTAGAEYMTTGWSSPDPLGVWTLGSDAGLNFRAADVGRGIIVELTGHGYVPRSDTAPSPVDVYANGEWLTTVQPTIRTSRMHLYLLPSQFAANGRMWLRLHVREPLRPADTGTGDDQRWLGLLLRTIELRVPRDDSEARELPPRLVGDE